MAWITSEEKHRAALTEFGVREMRFPSFVDAQPLRLEDQYRASVAVFRKGLEMGNDRLALGFEREFVGKTAEDEAGGKAGGEEMRVSEFKIGGDQGSAAAKGVFMNFGVLAASQPDIPHILRLETLLPQHPRQQARQILVHQEEGHRLRPGSDKLGGEYLGGVVEGRENVVSLKAVFAHEVAVIHSSGQLPQDNVDGDAGAFDDGLAEADGGVDDDSGGDICHGKASVPV